MMLQVHEGTKGLSLMEGLQRIHAEGGHSVLFSDIRGIAFLYRSHDLEQPRRITEGILPWKWSKRHQDSPGNFLEASNQ
jgi:hypothetical protein